jgi:hypothetical protein
LSKIETAKKKIQFAEYLINRHDSTDFSKGANKHLCDAARLAIRELLQFDEEEMSRKSRVISSFQKTNNEYSDFYKFYYKFKESEYSSTSSASNALNTVRAFVNWVEENRRIN